jgi:nicotinamidase-related amidase
VPQAASLLERADSIILAIDLQPGFFAGPPGSDRGALPAALPRAIARAAWLVGVATALRIPVIVTEEDPPRNGPTDPAVLAAAAPSGGAARVFVKRTFGLADQDDIRAAVEVTGRRTAVLVGAETDVCVAHSALGLLDRGFRVAVVTDATFSPGEMHDLGLRRMRDAGVIEVHAKGAYYEWVRTLAEARRFEAAFPELADPPGFAL